MAHNGIAMASKHILLLCERMLFSSFALDIFSWPYEWMRLLTCLNALFMVLIIDMLMLKEQYIYALWDRSLKK